MRFRRQLVTAVLLTSVAVGWAETDPIKQKLESAAAEVTYMSFDLALPIYEEVAEKAQVASEPWQEATFGVALCHQQTMPASQQSIAEAKRHYLLLVERSPGSRFAPRAMMNLGRIAELVDYSGDTPDRDAAREWYGKAMQAAKGTPLEAEALLRTAATYIQTYKKDSINQGLKLLHVFLEQHPKDPLASAMWQYMGETYFWPLEDYKSSLQCYKEADALGLLEEGREGPVYWRMAVMADRYLEDRETAIEYYRKIIVKTPTSGKAYEAQLALKAMGIEPPKIELFEMVASQNGQASAAPATAPAATEQGVAQ